MIKFRNNVYVGGYKDIPTLNSEDGLDRTAREHSPAAKLNSAGINTILNVAYELDDPPMYPVMMRYVKIGLMDNNDNPEYMKDLAVKTLEIMLDKGETVLVHCAAGLSRSVYVAVMAVANREKKEPHDVFDELQMNHAWAMYGPLFTGTNRLYRHYKDLEDGKVPFADESTAQKGD